MAENYVDLAKFNLKLGGFKNAFEDVEIEYFQNSIENLDGVLINDFLKDFFVVYYNISDLRIPNNRKTDNDGKYDGTIYFDKRKKFVGDLLKRKFVELPENAREVAVAAGFFSQFIKRKKIILSIDEFSDLERMPCDYVNDFFDLNYPEIYKTTYRNYTIPSLYALFESMAIILPKINDEILKCIIEQSSESYMCFILFDKSKYSLEDITKTVDDNKFPKSAVYAQVEGYCDMEKLSLYSDDLQAITKIKDIIEESNKKTKEKK